MLQDYKNKIHIEIDPNGLIAMYNPDGKKIIECKDIPNDVKTLVGISINKHNNQNYESGVNILKTNYQWFTKVNKITPSNALKILRGFVANEIVKKHPYWFAVIRSRQLVNTGNQRLELLAYEPEAQQAEKDGIRNIAPLIIAFQKNPKELKEYLGKSLWKSLCKNTYNRNLLIARQLVREQNNDHVIKYTERLNKFPSTILASRIGRTYSVGNTEQWLYCLNVLKKDFKVPYCKIQSQEYRELRNDVVNTVFDTAYEMHQDGIEVNYSWSYRRFKEEHEKLIRTRAERYRKQKEAQQERFKELMKIDIRTLHEKLDTIEYNGAIATPLTSFDAVRSEGDKMHHCVGDYAERCASGKYLVYSIKSDSGVYSTLGISVVNTELTQARIDKVLNPNKKKYLLNQHYLACNKVVTDENVLTLATKVVEYLNS